MKRKSDRGGYAMLLVLAFVTLFFSLLAVAYGQLVSSIRADTVRAQQLQRDEGSVHALARGLALLETGYPPSTPYACAVTIDTSTGSYSYTVTFTLDAPQSWSVTSAPTADGETPDAMPLVFTSQSPP
jgi:hypothetical protein